MTVHELMSKLAEVSMEDPDMEVEVHAVTGIREIESEITEDANAGDSILTETFLDEYAEDISVKKSNVGGHEKVCITADCG